MKTTALIMAGGRGERFWPKSRKAMPKQFLSLSGDGRTMIQLTAERIRPLVEAEDIFIVTNRSYRSLVREQLPEIPEENILCEPVGRNTAPCIGLGAMHIRKKYGEAVMFVLPSDHLIKYNAMYQRTLRDAAKVAEEGLRLVTLGITPTYPETGYGYIRYNPDQTAGRAFAVEEFAEKPDAATAKRYVDCEQYLWNSGMFVWKVSSILENIRTSLPEMYAGLERIAESIGTGSEERVLAEEFERFDSVSVDYGIMEHAEDIYVLASSFGWDDVGSWLAVERTQSRDADGNVVCGNVVSVDTRNTIIQGGSRLIATAGVKDLIIVDSGDALLVCGKSEAGQIKSILAKIPEKDRDRYL